MAIDMGQGTFPVEAAVTILPASLGIVSADDTPVAWDKDG
jgi:hypothetical protein